MMYTPDNKIIRDINEMLKDFSDSKDDGTRFVLDCHKEPDSKTGMRVIRFEIRELPPTTRGIKWISVNKALPHSAQQKEIYQTELQLSFRVLKELAKAGLQFLNTHAQPDTPDKIMHSTMKKFKSMVNASKESNDPSAFLTKIRDGIEKSIAKQNQTQKSAEPDEDECKNCEVKDICAVVRGIM